ncbi:prepilin-type N-terminal cleavage/methylation domain-containing protein, partial [bacterium]|nr:prepilin-type N-terminal cleavage/methylation domain-containing protein [bacterium]
MIKKYLNNKKSGFTLIEMVVVVAVISVLFAASIEMFSNMYSISVRTNDSRLALQEARYALDTITREARDSLKLNPVCSGMLSVAPSVNCDTLGTENTIKLESKEGKTIDFACSDCNNSSTTGKVTMDTTNADGTQGQTRFLTSNSVEVVQFFVRPQDFATETAGLDRGTVYYPVFNLRIQVRGKVADRTGQKPIVTLETAITRNPYSEITYCDVFGCGEAQISCDSNVCLALKSNGEVWAIGTSSYKQHGLVVDSAVWAKTPAGSFGGRKIIKTSVGTFGSLALDSTGGIWGVGRNTYGSLGMPDNYIPSTTAITDWRFSRDAAGTFVNSGFVDITHHEVMSLAIKSDGT